MRVLLFVCCILTACALPERVGKPSTEETAQPSRVGRQHAGFFESQGMRD